VIRPCEKTGCGFSRDTNNTNGQVLSGPTTSGEDLFDTVFYPGGHGPMWDLADDKHSIKLIESFLAAGRSA
jgi:putative intracellular protease/amidase